jgi:3-phenylpropionate/cinnamic acid dioxygenase small subunit
MSARTEPAAPALMGALEQFLYQEARLLDSGRLDEWLQLFTADGTYWIPLEANQRDPYETSSIVFDDRTLLEARVRQYAHPRAHARMPLMRTVHQVGNVMLLEEHPERGEFLVASTQLLVEFRAERQRVFGALCEHRLRRSDDSFQIAAKRIDIVNSESELDGIAVLF